MDGILKFLTCGSVDDGKSTLIGRLLYETGNVFDDHLETLKLESARIGNADGKIDYSLLLDGLMAEREQGITIDVAYRYFSTTARKFIVADTPGHVQYTRNMATGASNCDAAIILVDARLGVLAQTRRHALICSLMGIKHILFAVNKMDLVNWDRFRFESIRVDCLKISEDLANLNLKPDDFTCVPVSALNGDNLATMSNITPWYNGRTILNWLETIKSVSDNSEKDFRLPIQYVIKPGMSAERWLSESLESIKPEEQKNFRGYSGRVASGTVSTNDNIIILPSGQKSSVKSIYIGDTTAEKAIAGDSISITLKDEIDVSRGDCIAHEDSRPELSDQFKARIVWMDQTPLYPGRMYRFKSSFGYAMAEITHIANLIDMSGYQKLSAEKIDMNDIAEVEIKISKPTPYAPYKENRETGSFILIDRITNATSGCGMIEHSLRRAQNVHWQAIDITRESRARLMGQKPALIWLTGLSGAGKSTIANIVEKELFALNRHTMLLDGDNIRHGLNRDLGFTETDRIENIRRIAEVAKLMSDAGLIVLTSFISPFRAEREFARSIMPDGEFIEVFIDTPIEVCEERDTKGLYKKARNGKIPNFTGINSPYESPESPEITLETTKGSPEELAGLIITYLKDKGII